MTGSAALFLLLVFIPGWVFAWSSGRLRQARENVGFALYYGGLNFLIGLAVLFWGWPGQVRALFDLALRPGTADVPLAALARWVGTFVFTAGVLGTVQLLLDVRSARILKASLGWQKFVAGRAPLDVSPSEDLLREVLLCYRVARKRPRVVLFLGGGSRPFAGEVLKARWGGAGSLLVADMDNPGSVALVPLAQVRMVRFENPGLISRPYILDPGTREVLNLIHPGHGDEVEERLRQEVLGEK